MRTGAFLEANDQINTALARFEAFQRGDLAAVSSIPTSIGSDQAGSSNVASLIDLDDETSGIKNQVAVDDLSVLFASSSQPPPVNNATRPTRELLGGAIQLPGTPKPSLTPTRAAGSTIGSQSSTLPNNPGAMQSTSTSAVNAAPLSQPQPRPANNSSALDPFADLAGLF